MKLSSKLPTEARSGPADAQAEVIFEITIPGNCINTGVNKVSADLEEDNRVYSPNALTYNVFEGGSKRSRHSAPKGTSEEEWANMSRQQHKDWRALHPKSVNPKVAVENPMAVQCDGGQEAVDIRISDLDTEPPVITKRRKRSSKKSHPHKDQRKIL